MKTKQIDKLIWALIFAGIVVVGLGLSVQQTDESLGWIFVVVGGLLLLAGVVLVWVRSRMSEPDPS